MISSAVAIQVLHTFACYKISYKIKMVDMTEDNQPLPATNQMTKFSWSRKGKILAIEIVLCVIVTICKAVTFGCFLWSPITELVCSIIILIMYATGLNLKIVFFLWTDFFRAITGTLMLFVTSIVCFCLQLKISGEVVGSVFGLLAAAVFGYDTIEIKTQIKEVKQQDNTTTVVSV